MRKNQKLLADEGIALVVMDCPTDQWGQPGCGGGNLHSHQGNEEAVVRAIITWIKSGKTEPFVGSAS